MTNSDNDPLDRETSVSAELTETGVKAKTNSRAVNALDRLVGNMAEVWNASLERTSAKSRAISSAEVEIIRSAGRALAEEVGADKQLAARTLQGHLDGIVRKQQNKEAVALESVEQLKLSPPADDESSKGPEQLSEEFMSNFEPYAERATTDILRQKWAKVLVSEIKEPGTFTSKAMRVVDELDAETAKVFEKLCESRLNNALPKGIVGEISFKDRTALAHAELLMESELGHVRIISEGSDGSGAVWYVCGFGNQAVGFPKETPTNMLSLMEISDQDGKKTLPIYLLTEVGKAIASILPNHERDARSILAAKMADKMRGVAIREYESLDGQNLTCVNETKRSADA